MSNRFDLDTALSAWRRSLEYNRAFDADDLDELERHVRDQVEALARRGVSQEDAFHRALREMGHYGAVEAEYRKVYWSKRRRRGEVFHEINWRFSMLANYIKVALRNVNRRKGYTLINVVGLALGMACSLLIFLYVQDELGYDRFHEAAETTYRVNWDFRWNDNEGVGPGTPPPLAATFTDELPEVTAATRLYPVSRRVVRHEDTFFNEDRIVAADTNFFAFFDFPLVEGHPATVLAAPNSVVLTETTARKYFGDTPAVGQVLTIGSEKQLFGRTYQPTFRVTGIVADPPPNSHIQFDLLTSMASHPQVAYFDWSWIWMQVTTYVRLAENASMETLASKVRVVVARHAPDAFERIGFSYEDLLADGGRWDFVFQPLTDVYLGSAHIGNRLGPVGNRTYILLFSAVAVLVLLVACINYMNLATARSAARAQEVGMRKVLGARRRGLVGQFLAESMVLSALALPLALVAVVVALGPFNRLAGTALSLSLSPEVVGVLVGLLVLVGLGAGSYPGFYLSAFRPVQVLKGTIRSGRRSRRLRDGLVVGQFATTIALIACTLGVRQQMNFVRRADLGFDRDGIVVISNVNHPLGDRVEAFKEEVERHPGVRQAAVSTGVPPTCCFQDYYKIEGQGDTQFELTSYMTDADFAATLGLEIVQGRGFSEDRPADAESVILNETAVQTFGLDDPIGKTITYPSVGTYRIIGVVNDFHYMTLHLPIAPFALFHKASASYDIPDSYVVVRLADTDVEKTMQRLAATWQAFVPDTPFDYTFLNEGFDAQYQADQRLGRLFMIFSLLTICIACMGLLGLAAFSAEQRTKEIGIRKVLGASVSNIVGLLSKDFLKLIGLAFIVATPVAYLALQRWLADFAYRIELSGWIFLVAGLTALGIALMTVSYQALKAALTDPVESLRYE